MRPPRRRRLDGDPAGNAGSVVAAPGPGLLRLRHLKPPVFERRGVDIRPRPTHGCRPLRRLLRVVGSPPLTRPRADLSNAGVPPLGKADSPIQSRHRSRRFFRLPLVHDLDFRGDDDVRRRRVRRGGAVLVRLRRLGPAASVVAPPPRPPPASRCGGAVPRLRLRPPRQRRPLPGVRTDALEPVTQPRLGRRSRSAGSCCSLIDSRGSARVGRRRGRIGPTGCRAVLPRLPSTLRRPLAPRRRPMRLRAVDAAGGPADAGGVGHNGVRRCAGAGGRGNGFNSSNNHFIRAINWSKSVALRRASTRK